MYQSDVAPALFGFGLWAKPCTGPILKKLWGGDPPRSRTSSGSQNCTQQMSEPRIGGVFMGRGSHSFSPADYKGTITLCLVTEFLSSRSSTEQDCPLLREFPDMIPCLGVLLKSNTYCKHSYSGATSLMSVLIPYFIIHHRHHYHHHMVSLVELLSKNYFSLSFSFMENSSL